MISLCLFSLLVPSGIDPDCSLFVGIPDWIQMERSFNGPFEPVVDESTIIYSNNTGQFAWRIQPTGTAVADDISTNAVGDCEIETVVIRVKGFSDGGGVFDVQTKIWDGCPILDGSSVVPDTEISHEGLDGDSSIDHDLQLLPSEGLVLPPKFWVEVWFSTRGAGWYFGEPATVGLSCDRYFHPIAGCNTWHGGYSDIFHSSGYVVVRAKEGCKTKLQFDFDEDGDIDLADFAIFQRGLRRK